MHGPGAECFVCAHLVVPGPAQGFNVAHDDLEERPDAWCDACDELLQSAGGDWEALGDRHPEIRVVCAGCYDQLRARHLSE